MEDNEKNLAELAKRYSNMLYNVQLPECNVEDLLDLVDYHTSLGMEFEAELYKRIAVLKYPTHPDVILMCAHWEADDGDWKGVEKICNSLEVNKYDETLFSMEKMLRMMLPRKAYEKVSETLSPLLENEDYDFLFDASELFRDFGYMHEAVSCLMKIPTSYEDYRQVLELAAECLFYLSDFDGSLDCLDRAIDLNPFDDYLWAQSALLQYKKADYNKALDACEYALAIQKENTKANHTKNLLTWQEDKQYDMTKATYIQQDYGAFMEIAELHYQEEDYLKAESEFMVAGYYCPRGNRDRIQIVFKTACCRVLSHRAKEGVSTLLSVIHQGFDLWPYASELMQLLLTERQSELLDTLFQPIIALDKLSNPRKECLIESLSAHEVYTQAKKTWEYLLLTLHEYKDPYKEMALIAQKRLNNQL